MHLANCAVVSVQRAEQLASELGEPPGGRRFIPTTYFLQSKFNQPFTARLSTASPRETKRRLMEAAQNCAETALNCTESDLGPDFIGTLVPNFS